ncbi:MAG: hypothetical protein KAS17_08665 [Victivallaceae bacterium]|nr:hypothetical protein [Victivallaceae bacterium]
MSNSVFTNWTGAARHLNEKIKNNSLIAGRGIKLENTGNGIRIHGLANNIPGDTYKGYFKVIQTAANKIKIVDGMDITAENCGNVSVNKLTLAPIAAAELTITADAFIYLECVAVGDPLTSSTNTIVQYATEQSWETGKEKILISRVTFANGAITDFSIEPVSSRINIRGAC